MGTQLMVFVELAVCDSLVLCWSQLGGVPRGLGVWTRLEAEWAALQRKSWKARRLVEEHHWRAWMNRKAGASVDIKASYENNRHMGPKQA